MAPKGILSNDPVSAELAASSPISSGLNDMVCLSVGTMGPKADTPANPPKKAMVDQVKAARGLDLA
jgi:hypothetical protein